MRPSVPSTSLRPANTTAGWPVGSRGLAADAVEMHGTLCEGRITKKAIQVNTITRAEKERLELRERLVRALLGEEVAAWQRPAAHVAAHAARQTSHHVVEPAHGAARHPTAPAADTRPCSPSAAVVLEVDRRAGAVVLAGGVDRRRVAEAAQVLAPGLGREAPSARRTARSASAGRTRRCSPISVSGSGAGWIRKNQW